MKEARHPLAQASRDHHHDARRGVRVESRGQAMIVVVHGCARVQKAGALRIRPRVRGVRKMNPSRVPTTVQTLLFDRGDFTLQKAMGWARSHGFKVPTQIEQTPNYFHMRQRDPSQFIPGSFKTIELREGIKARVGYLLTARARMVANPSPVDRLDLRPHWVPLRRGGAYNALAREAMRGKSGVYAVREPESARTVLYVGESHSPAGSPLRWWKTLLRHFQPGSGTFEARSEWVHKRGGDLDVALWRAAPSEAREVEGQLIAELEPIHARSGFESAPEDVEGVPF